MAHQLEEDLGVTMQCHHNIGEEGHVCFVQHEGCHAQEDGSGWYLDAQDAKYYVDSRGTEYYPDASVNVGQAEDCGIPYVRDEVGVPYYAEDEGDINSVIRAALEEVDRFGEIPPNWDPFNKARELSVPSPKELGYEDTSKHLPHEIIKRISIDSIATAKTELSSSSHPEQDHGINSTSSDSEDAKSQAQSPYASVRDVEQVPEDDRMTALVPYVPQEGLGGGRTRGSKHKRKAKKDKKDDAKKTVEQDVSQRTTGTASRSPESIGSQATDLQSSSDDCSTSFGELNASKESLVVACIVADGGESSQSGLDANFSISRPQDLRLEDPTEPTQEKQEACKAKQKSVSKRASRQSDKPLKREPSSRGRSQKQEPPGMDDSSKSHGSAKSITRKIRSESRRRRRETVLEKSERSRSSSVRSDRKKQRSGPLQPSGRASSVGPRRQTTFPASRRSYSNDDDDDEQGPPLTCPNLPSRRGRARGSRRNLMADNSSSSRSTRSSGPPLRRATSHQDISSRPLRGAEGPPLTRQNSLVGGGGRRGGFTRSRGDRSRSQRNLVREGYASVVDHYKKDEDAELRQQVITATVPIDPKKEDHKEKKKGQMQDISSRFVGLRSNGTGRASVRHFGFASAAASTANVMASFAKTAVGATVNTAATVGHVGLATTQMAAGATMKVGKTAANVGLATTQVAAGATMLVAKTAVNTTVGAAKLAAEAGKNAGPNKSQSLQSSLRGSQTGQFTYVMEEGGADDLTAAEMLVKRHGVDVHRPPAQTHQVTAMTA